MRIKSFATRESRGRRFRCALAQRVPAGGRRSKPSCREGGERSVAALAGGQRVPA